VDLQTGVRRIWPWHRPPQVLLSASLRDYRHSGAIVETTSLHLGGNERVARNSGPSDQAAMRKRHQSIVIDSQSSSDLIESLSQPRSSLRKQRRPG